MSTYDYPKTPAEYIERLGGEGVLKIQASYLVKHQVDCPEQPQRVEYTAYFLTEEAAQEYLARFPKSAGLHVSTTSFGASQKVWHVKGQARLLADGVNGGRNETGIKRFQRVLATAAKQDLPIRYETPFANSVPTLDALLALLQEGA
jgi:hypothetical protein